MTAALTGITPRPYQDEAHAWATSHDAAVVCLPTGTGKTHVGCMWARTRLHQSGIDRILILEPSRFLVEQTHAYYIDELPVRLLSKAKPVPSGRHYWCWSHLQ